MTRKKVLYIECTHTLISGLNTGIQRVVREVIHHLPAAVDLSEYDVKTIIFDRDRFVEQEFVPYSSVKSKMTLGQKIFHLAKVVFLSLRKSMGFFFPEGRAKFFLVGPRYDKRTLAYAVGFHLVEPIFMSIRKIKQLFEFEKYKKSSRPKLDFMKGDILLLLDSSWYLKFWSEIKRFKDQGGKVYNVVYDLIPVTHPEFCDDFLVHVFKKYFFTSIDYVDKYICISKTVANDLELFLKASLNKATQFPEVSFFHLGSNFRIRNFQVDDVDVGIKNIFRKNIPIYLIVSTLEPRKNHKYLLKVFDSLWASKKEVGLCIVGRIGWKVDDLMNVLLRHPQLGKKLFLFNDASDADVSYCYQHAKGLLFPSIVEGFGLPIIEGLQRGLPVFASGTNIHKEVGKEMVNYFNNDDPKTLENLILDHLSNESKYQKKTGEISIANWNESAAWLWREIDIKGR